MHYPSLKISKSITFATSKVVIIVIVMDVWIKSMLNISAGSFFSLYKDIIIAILFYTSVLCFLMRPKNIIRNKIDYFIVAYMIYAIFEIFWTYYLTGSYLIGLASYRLYFLIFILYFYFRYFYIYNYKLLSNLWRFLYKLIFFIILVTMLEFILVSTGIISSEIIPTFLERGMGELEASAYPLSNDINWNRGFGILGSVLLNGVLCAVGFSLIAPTYNVFSRKKSFLFIGFFAVIVSGAKTAWLLLFIVMILMAINSKHQFIYKVLSLLMFISGIYIYANVQNLAGSIDSMVFKVLPKYILSLRQFLEEASLLQLLLGGGYSINPIEMLQKIGTIQVNIDLVNIETLSIGSEVFIISILKQFGMAGVILYIIGFIYIPFSMFFNKNISSAGHGAALAIFIAGISSIHYNAIFRSGVNIIICLCLFYLSIELDMIMKKKENYPA